MRKNINRKRKHMRKNVELTKETIKNKFLRKKLLMFFISLNKCLKNKVLKMFGRQTRLCN